MPRGKVLAASRWLAPPEQAKHANRMRLAAMGRVPCRRCSGSGIHQSPTLTARVCGACGGRGYTIPRELSSGSWFEPEGRVGVAGLNREAIDKSVEIAKMADRVKGKRTFKGRRYSDEW